MNIGQLDDFLAIHPELSTVCDVVVNMTDADGDVLPHPVYGIGLDPSGKRIVLFAAPRDASGENSGESVGDPSAVQSDG